MSGIININDFHCSEDLYFNGFPSNLSLEVTNRCNLKCTHCHHTYRKKMLTGDLTLEIFEKLLPYLGNEIRNISLNGLGEPLLSEQWETICNTCLAVSNLKVSFITNGIIQLKNRSELLRDNLSITFSLDGASSASYKKIRQTDVFDHVISHIKAIDDYKKSRDSVYPSLGAIFVVTLQNMHEMPEFIRLAHKIGISHVTFSHLVAHFESQLINESAFFMSEKHDQYLMEAQNQAGELGIDIVHMGKFSRPVLPEYAGKNWLYKDSGGNIRCGLINSWCMINYTGHVQVCCAPDSLIAGDLREDSLFEIWNGAVYRKLKTGLSHSFEKTCGNICNLRQSISLDDIRAFFCKMYETYDYNPQNTVKQPYSITNLNSIYNTAVKALQAGDLSTAIEKCVLLLNVEPLAFEAENLKGIALALSGEREKAVHCFLRSYTIYKDYEISMVNLRILAGNSAKPVLSSASAQTILQGGLINEQ